MITVATLKARTTLWATAQAGSGFEELHMRGNKVDDMCSSDITISIGRAVNISTSLGVADGRISVDVASDRLPKQMV